MPFDYTGSFSGSFTGDITSTNGVISSSAQVVSNLPSGVVSASAQINYRDVQNKPATISAFQKNAIIANNHFRETTYRTDSASFDSRINGVGTDITALDARIDALSVGSGSADWATITNIPSGLVSGSSQITNVVTDTYISASAAASGFGQGGGTSDFTQLTNVPIGLVSGSSQIAALGYLTSASAAALGFGSGGGTSDFTQLTNVPSGLVSGSTQITNVITDSYISASAVASGFGAGGETYTAGLGISISGNAISIDTSSTHFRLGVSGAAAFYGFGGGGGSFGDPPVIDQDGLQIHEFTGSGVFVGTLTVTDPTPGDTATWATQSGYSAGYFGISTGGNVTTLQSPSAAWNTSAGSGSNNAHPFLIQVTDGQNNIVTGTIYIYVLPNNAPVFRQTSVGGSIITSFTSSGVNENSTAGATVATIYFTDEEGDTITIGSGSWSYGDSTHFTITKNATNVVITQATSSLDYETYDHYQLYLTASDSKYPSPDSDSITYLPVRIAVTDNLAPTLNNQSVTGVNENSANGTSAGNITITDEEGDASATIVSMTLKSAYMNGVGTNVTASMGGTSLYDPHDDAFTHSGITIVRRNGVYINSDIANRYDYTVGVQDAFNATINYGVVTIPIADATVYGIGSDGVDYYTLESSVQGDNLTQNPNGYTITNVTFTSAVSQMWVVNSNPSGYVRFVGGNTTATALTTPALELAQNVSGSGLTFDSGSTIDIQITASQTSFESTKQYRDHTLNVVYNAQPTGSYAATSANLNTNGARSGNTLYTLTWTDRESDSLNHSTFELTSNAGITSSWNGGYIYTITATGSIADGTYYISASIKDEHGFRTGTKNQTMVIAQADTGSLTTNGTFYVIESATSGAFVYTSTNGRTGTRGDLGVTYSPEYNSAAVQSFTSSNALIGVTKGGLLSVSNVSGSGYTYDAGTPITSSITWRDQYNNIGGPTQISVNVAINNAPVITFTNAGSTVLNTNVARSASNPTLSTITFTDAESNALNHNTFTFTDPSGQLSASRIGDTWYVKPITNLSASVYQMTASIKDVHGFRVGSQTNTFDIIKAKIGSFSQPSLFIVESALSGAGVTTESDGSGSAYTLSITYSPNYGTQTATNFSASGDGGYVFVHPTSGVVTIYNNLSGSAVQNEASLTPLITWNDSYGNLGSQSLSVSVTDNQAATATFANLTANWVGNPVASGVGLVSASILDSEVQIVSMSLSGTDAGSLVAVPQTFNSSSYVIKSATTLTPATYLYSASIHDNYGNTTSYNRSIVVTAPSINPLVYLYDIGYYNANYNFMLGYSSATLAQPSVISTATVASGYGWAEQAKTYLGDTSFNFSFGSSYTSNLLASASVDSIRELVTEFGTISRNSSNGFVLCIPSGSGLSDIPRQMRNGYGGSADREYVLEVASDGAAIGSGLGTSQTSYIHQFSLNSALNGYTDYIFIGSPTQIASSTSVLMDVRPSSGSAT